jgi:hypothetical protein
MFQAQTATSVAVCVVLCARYAKTGRDDLTAGGTEFSLQLQGCLRGWDGMLRGGRLVGVGAESLSHDGFVPDLTEWLHLPAPPSRSPCVWQPQTLWLPSCA